VDRLGADVGP